MPERGYFWQRGWEVGGMLDWRMASVGVEEPVCGLVVGQPTAYPLVMELLPVGRKDCAWGWHCLAGWTGHVWSSWGGACLERVL